MAKRETQPPVRRPGSGALKGRPLDDNGAIEFSGPEVGLALGADEDEVFVTQVGRAVVGFLGKVAGFFTTAKALEQTALELLDTSKILTVPTTAAEDEELQRFIKRTTAAKRDLEAHWNITATISQFHKRLTARRARGTDAADAANKRGNLLHNTFTEQERRRAQEEQLRLEREAEERARADRQRELDELEAAAVAREEAAGELSAREQVFVEQISRHGDGIRAARDAGFPDAVKSSTRLLKLAKIKAAIQGAQEAAAIRRQATAKAARPLEVGPVETVAPAIRRAPGVQERTTHHADLIDENRLVEWLLEGVRRGDTSMPLDLLRIDTTKLGQYARDLEARVGQWPGVRYRKETKVI